MYKLCKPRLFLAILAVLFIVSCVPGAAEPGLPVEPAYPAPAYPPPPTLEAAPDLFPLSTRIIQQPGDDYYDMGTPIPTFTPRPTPTRRPGPTPTPFPIQRPASNPAGVILYDTLGPYIKEYSVDEQGQVVPETVPSRISLEFDPILSSTSPDGRYLLLLRPAEPGGIPFILDMQKQQLWPLFRNDPMQQDMVGWPYGWHPDSRQVLFWSEDNEELLLVDINTGLYTILAYNHGPVQGAAISPDGAKIVYVGSSGADEIIWIVSAAGSDAKPLYDPEGISYVFGWSPDGANIIYVGGSNSSKEDMVAGTASSPLWLMDSDGQNRRQLSGPYPFGYGFKPIWSPDSQWIAYTGIDKGQSFGCVPPEPDWETCEFEGTVIYIENVQNGEVRKLSPGIMPGWSPDGSMIAFLSIQSGTPEIWRIRIDGTDLLQLTTDTQQKYQFVWIPSGR